MKSFEPLAFIKVTLVAVMVVTVSGCGEDAADLDRDTPSESLRPEASAESPPEDASDDASPPEVEADERFSIELAFPEPITTRQAQAFETARQRWERVIVQGLPTVTITTELLESACGITVPGDEIQIDDLLIFAVTGDIDGPGEVLGQAGPCIARGNGGGPLVGVMTFDTADLDALENIGGLDNVILHEMGHVLGIGTLWRTASLIENPSLPEQPDADTRFTGPLASRISDALVGSGDSVPVENGARRGASDGHWRESVFGNELMTPFLNGLTSSAPLSELTIASLEDLGFYVTDRSAADPFVPAPVQRIAKNATDLSCELIRPAAYVSPDP